MNNRYRCLALLLIVQIFFSFSSLKAQELNFDFNFSIGNEEWVGDFADYDVGQESSFELAWGWSNIPVNASVEEQPKGMFLSGNNHSDNLFMFIKRQIEGLKPNTTYDLTFLVTIQDNIPPEQFGIGGSPGECVFFKVGASKREPKKIAKGSMYELNVNKGFQAEEGKHALVVGDLANPLVNPDDPHYEAKNFVNEIPLKVKTDSEGRLWLFVGTDSGFEGPTLYYFSKISVLAKPAERL
jgi:hypothetical protein